jgi:integrase/recombinase XerD
MASRPKGRPSGTTGKAAVLNDQQIRQVFRFAESRPRFSARARAALALSLGVGLRAKELASLRWSDVFTPEGEVREVLHLKCAYTKGEKSRDVYLSAPKLRRVLEDYFEASWPLPLDWPLFKSQKGGSLTPSSMARFLTGLYREANIPKASSHSGRRTLITQLAEKGIDLKAISIIAGHANVRTTAIYVETSPVRLSRILQDVRW